MDLGKRLRELRQRNQYSLYDVERSVGLHFSTIAKYERNERQPGIDVLRDLAALYQVPVAALISDLDDLEDVLSQEQIRWLRWLDDRPRLAQVLARAAAAPDPVLDAVALLLEPHGRGGSPDSPEGEPSRKDS